MLTAADRALCEEHIHDLAIQHRVVVHYNKDYLTSEADIDTRQVFVPSRFRTGVDYLAALHEFGHIVDRTSRRRHGRGTVRASARERHDDGIMCEAAAWAWALRTARPKLLKVCTDADWRKVGYCWSTHVRP